MQPGLNERGPVAQVAPGSPEPAKIDQQFPETAAHKSK
jgi:hypothetical protein